MTIKNKVLAYAICFFSIVGVFSTVTNVYENYTKDEFERNTDEYFNGFRGGARSFYRMDSADLSSDIYGRDVDYHFVEDLAQKSLTTIYPESKDWDSVYDKGFIDGYIAKYVYSYFNGD
ncbi:hypothetical protein [Bacillus sp. B15-48]|uniref:hypothetical protein n=1 Tax=Bacillus sp. B15-48 TaxID=1548601 RepID=UPI00193FE5FE|nr:hypothetical protein [Bacillus sp. B15-48]MBM4764794.1 hypothetical protein [Bacillus sp. B15-48]